MKGTYPVQFECMSHIHVPNQNGNLSILMAKAYSFFSKIESQIPSSIFLEKKAEMPQNTSTTSMMTKSTFTFVRNPTKTLASKST